mgnify:CR=1 FL=1
MRTLSGVERLLSSLTPESVEALVRDLVKEQPPDRQTDVTFPTILDALTKHLDLGTGSKAWSAQLRLKKAIREALEGVKGMKWVEGDS